MNKTILLSSFIIFFSACKDKDDPVPPAQVSLMATTTGSTWNYSTQANLPTTTTGTYKLTATSKDTTYNSKTYKVFTNSNTGSDYYNQTGTDYYQFGNNPAVNQQLELLYLKDAAAGTVWTESKPITLLVSGFPVTATVPFNCKVAETGISYTVNGKTYTDVTHVQITMGAFSAGGVPVTPVSDFNYYYARGIGRIYSRTTLAISIPVVGVNINTDDEVKLTSYTIL